MKRITFIWTSIVTVIAVVADAQPTHTNRASSLETIARIPPLQMVNSVLISPDGKTIATLRGEGTSWKSWDKPLTLQLWSVPKGNLLWTARERAFYLFAFSPDSTRLVGIAEDSAIVLWDTAYGRVKSRLRKKNLSVSAAAFLPDGQILVMAVNKWAEKGVHALTSGSTLAVANEFHGLANTLNVLDIATDSVRHTLELQKTIGDLTCWRGAWRCSRQLMARPGLN